MSSVRPQHVLLLTAPGSYRAEAFLLAARRLDITTSEMVDAPPALAGNCALAADFRQPAALTTIITFAQQNPLAAIIAVDDSGSLLAAEASAQLGLPHNAPTAAIAARNKFVMRQMLAAGSVAIPHYALHSLQRRAARLSPMRHAMPARQTPHQGAMDVLFAIDEDLTTLAAQIEYPCVVKPLELNGSRGVIRADTPAEFIVATQRLAAILRRIYPEGSAPVILDGVGVCDSARQFLIEEFIPGFEVALEGLLDRGKLQVLALFDKPDPLDGPFFEETIYVTPSRLSPDIQAAIHNCAAQAAAAMGLRAGPMHAELRVNARGPWLVEAAGRSIGGLCSQTLQFGTDASLEELILRQACGLPVDTLGRSGNAGGVMMIPIPASGILRGISGQKQALAVAGVTSIEITATLNNPILALPEGESYLGFIFARGATPADVEQALRTAHACLEFQILPHFEL